MHAQERMLRRWRTIAVLAVGVAIGTTMTATPAAGHVTSSVLHIRDHMKQYFFTKTQSDDRYVNAIAGTDKANAAAQADNAANADTLDGQDSSAFLGAGAKAADANALDGLDSAAFQRDVSGSCPAGTGMGSISNTGVVTCNPAATSAQTQVADSAVSATTAFILDPARVTAGTGETIFVTSTAALGSTAAGGAGDLDLWVCYRAVGDAGAPTTVGLGSFDNRVAQNTRHHFTLSSLVPPPSAGTYDVALCGASSNAANWNSNEFGYTTAFVLRVGAPTAGAASIQNQARN